MAGAGRDSGRGGWLNVTIGVADRILFYPLVSVPAHIRVGDPGILLGRQGRTAD